jgi:predicted nuclease of restriction endonuclease-like RecB superfamily
MLTADLAMSWQRGSRISPRLLNPQDAVYLRVAGDLIAIVHEHQRARRAVLERALDEYIGSGTDYKILRGLIKLLLDRCEFATVSAKEPAEIRRKVFLAARAKHPAGHERASVLAAVAEEWRIPSEEIEQGLYADLPANQVLVSFEDLTAEELLDRYNLAQAQALLYRCLELRLRVEPQEAAGYRRLFGAIKTYRLIHTVQGSAESGYSVRLDGPVSMFHRSQKYGIQMAVFLPALLLCKGWRMQAEIAGKRDGNPVYELNSGQTQLRSHYPAVPDYGQAHLEKFASDWDRLQSRWTLEPSQEVLDRGGTALIPDFRLRHPDGRHAYLELLGFWTPQHAEARAAEIERCGLTNYFVAVSDELRCSRDPAPHLPRQILLSKTNIDVRALEAALDALPQTAVSSEQRGL